MHIRNRIETPQSESFNGTGTRITPNHLLFIASVIVNRYFQLFFLCMRMCCGKNEPIFSFFAAGTRFIFVVVFRWWFCCLIFTIFAGILSIVVIIITTVTFFRCSSRWSRWFIVATVAGINGCWTFCRITSLFLFLICFSIVWDLIIEFWLLTEILIFFLVFRRRKCGLSLSFSISNYYCTRSMWTPSNLVFAFYFIELMQFHLYWNNIRCFCVKKKSVYFKIHVGRCWLALKSLVWLRLGLLKRMLHVRWCLSGFRCVSIRFCIFKRRILFCAYPNDTNHFIKST